MGVIACEIPAGDFAKIMRDVWSQPYLLRVIHRTIFFRGGVIRSVRRAKTDEETEGLFVFCLGFDVLLSISRLGNGIVAIPLQLFRAICVVEGVVIVVSAFENFPVFKSLPPLAWNKTGAPPAIDMPLANVACVVSSTV